MTNKGSMWPQGSTVVLPGKIPFIVGGPDGMCPSTHGGAGYAEGSYWDDGAIVCGICKYRIENPHPTGGRWVPAEGFIDRLLGRGEWVHDCYPDFILSKKPREDDND